MILEVETIMAVSLVMAVFAAVAAVGTSLVLGVGFERLRAGFEVVKKQTGFFSDAIHKLEEKVKVVDEQAETFDRSIHQLEAKVGSVGEQTNIFSSSISELEKKVEVVDKQTGFFSTAIDKLEKQIDMVGSHEEAVAEKMQTHAENDLISTGKAEALVSHAEDLLTQMSALAVKITDQHDKTASTNASTKQVLDFNIPNSVARPFYHRSEESEPISYH